MNGNKALLNSNLIIFFSKGKIDLKKLFLKYDKFYVSIITYMEVYAYEFADQTEKDLIDEFFNSLEIIGITRETADQVITYRKSKTKKLKLPDAIILATAKYLNADLLTDDYDDFENIDSGIKIINLDDLKT